MIIPPTVSHILTVRNAERLGTFVPPHPNVPIYEPFPNSCVLDNESDTDLATVKKEKEKDKRR